MRASLPVNHQLKGLFILVSALIEVLVALAILAIAIGLQPTS